MNERARTLLAFASNHRSIPFLIKSAILVGVLFLFANSAPVLPPFTIAAFWAALSAASAIGIVYHAIVRKTHKQLMLKSGGKLSKINKGRTFAFVFACALAAACAFGLILESPSWQPAEWGIVVASIPLYLALSSVIKTRLGTEYEQFYLVSRTVAWSSVATGIVLCIAYAIVVAIQPAATFGSATEAFLSIKQPFGESSSVLMSEAGTLTALIDGLTTYSMGKTAQTAFAGYVIWRAGIAASSLFSIATLLGTCSIKAEELKRVFAPLDAGMKSGAATAPIKKYVALGVALPLVLVAGFLTTEFQIARAAATQEYTAAEQFVRDQVGLAVYVIDGKYYDQQAVEAVIEETKAKSQQLSSEAKDTLVPLINQSFDARIANVDSYLDWYYSLPADYERLASLVTGSVESYAQEQFSAKIEAGVDDSALTEELERYTQQATELQTELMDALSSHELQGVPEWLITAQSIVDASSFSTTLEPTQKLLDVPARFGVSAGAGALAGIVAKQVAAKAFAKPFFSKIVSKITSALASKGIGAAIGGAAGSAAGPLGSIAGVAAGTVIGVGTDYGLLKLDELQNRESYRTEIIEAIEGERTAMLALVQ